MDAVLLDHVNLRIGDVYEADGEQDHSFGGPARHRGTQLSAIDRNAHLLMTFDLSDQRLGLRVPGLQTLPIYYAFHNDQGSFSYRVISETQIAILSEPYHEASKGTVIDLCSSLPLEFTKRPLKIDVSDYDPGNKDHLELCGSQFGVGRLTAEQQLLVKNRLEVGHLEMFTHPNYKLPPYDSLSELISNVFSFIEFPQGAPNDPCPNADCDNHSRWGSCRYWLVIDSHADDMGDLIQFREAIAGSDCGRLQVLMCPLCFSIRVVNVCT